MQYQTLKEINSTIRTLMSNQVEDKVFIIQLSVDSWEKRFRVVQSSIRECDTRRSTEDFLLPSSKKYGWYVLAVIRPSGFGNELIIKGQSFSTPSECRSVQIERLSKF